VSNYLTVHQHNNRL